MKARSSTRPGPNRPADRPFGRVDLMKLKCQPEDFRVEELTDAQHDDSGRYTFYRLSKRGLGTIEAVEAICRRWNLSGRQRQLCRPEGPACRHRPVPDDRRRTVAPDDTPQFELEPVGRLDRPYTSRQLHRQSLRAGPARPDDDRAGRAPLPRSRTSPGRAAQLFRRSTVRIGGLRGRVRRPGLAASATTSGPCGWRWRSPTPSTARRSRRRRRSCATTGATGPRRSGSCRDRRPAAS